MRFLVILALLALAACETVDVTYSTDYDAVHMFGSGLDASPGKRFLCWPADGNGDRFRCVEDSVGRQLKKQPVLLWPGDVRLPGSAGSVVVILPPGASGAQRARAGRLADDLTRGAPSAGRHFVTAESSWQDVTDAKDLAARLGKLSDRASERRTTDSGDGIFVRWDQLEALTPYAIVIPLEGDEDRQVVLLDVKRAVLNDRWTWSARERLSTAEILKLPGQPPRNDQPQLTIFEIAIPDAAGESARERAMGLASDLLRRENTSVYVRNVRSPGLEHGSLYPQEFTPPYIADAQPPTINGAQE